MAQAGDIYHCKANEGGPTSNHWWVLLYVDGNEVQYVTAASWKKKYQFHSSVFLDIQGVKDQRGFHIFSKQTVLNCYYPPRSIPRQSFDSMVQQGDLSDIGQLPDEYLAQIIPSARCSGQWSRADVKKVLDRQHGIGGCIDKFYDNLR